MTADELMTKLGLLFPQSFPGPEAAAAWSEVARTALGSSTRAARCKGPTIASWLTGGTVTRRSRRTSSRHARRSAPSSIVPQGPHRNSATALSELL